MLQRRKQLIRGDNQEVAKTIESETNFLVINKRKAKLRQEKLLEQSKSPIKIKDKSNTQQPNDYQIDDVSFAKQARTALSKIHEDEEKSDHLHEYYNSNHGLQSNKMEHTISQSATIQRYHTQGSRNVRTLSSQNDDSLAYSNTQGLSVKRRLFHQNREASDSTPKLTDKIKSRNSQSAYGHRSRIFRTLNQDTSNRRQRNTTNTFDKFKQMNMTITKNEFMTVTQNQSYYKKDNVVKNLSNQFRNEMVPVVAGNNIQWELTGQNPLAQVQNGRNQSMFSTLQFSQALRPQTQQNQGSRFKQPLRPESIGLNTLEVSKIPKFLGQANFHTTLNSTFQGVPVHITGHSTSGIPDTIIQRPRTSIIDHQSIAKGKDYLSTMVNEVIRKRIKHSSVVNDQVERSNQKIKEALVQIQRKRFRSINLFKGGKNKEVMDDRYDSSTFEEESCKPFVADKKGQVALYKQKTIQDNQSLLDADYLAQLSLNDFLIANHIFPQLYSPQFESKCNQVSRFEFYLVKGNQYIHMGKYAKAIRFFEEGLKVFDNCIPYLFNIALIHFLKERYDQAFKIYKKLHKMKPTSHTIFMSMLLTLLYQNELIKIVRYKDRNSLTRPRAMMSQQHININKIIIYASAKLHSQNIQVSSGFLFDSESEVSLKEVDVNSTLEGYDQLVTDDHNPNLQNRLINFDNKYFRKKVVLSKTKDAIKQILKKRAKSQVQEVSKNKSVNKSMIDYFKKDFEVKRRKFDEILESKRQVLKDKEVLYGSINTKIIKASRTPDNGQRRANLMFSVTPKLKRATSLDITYKKLSEVTQAFTSGMKDPIQETYKELVEDLRLFQQRIGIKAFVDKEKKFAKQQKEFKERPWYTKKILKREDSAMMKSKQMERAKAFIKSTMKSTKKSSYEMVAQIEGLIEQHIKEIQEEVKGERQRNLENEINSLIHDLSHNQKVKDYTVEGVDLNELDRSFVSRLEKMKNVYQFTEDQKLMKALGITGEDLIKRKELAQDKLQAVLCPDGVTSEDRESFDRETDEFLSYLYNNFIIKSAVVPGTDAPSIFRDSAHYEQIKKYLDNLSYAISARHGVFNDEIESEVSNVQWESPLVTKDMRKQSVYNHLVQKGKDFDSGSVAKNSLAYFFFQKINTMGLLNKIMKDNVSKVKTKKINHNGQEITASLSHQQLKYIQSQIGKKNHLILMDYHMLDNILCDIKFFAMFDKETRLKIYKLGIYSIHEDNEHEIIDLNIEKSDSIYVILQGTVTLVKKDAELGLEIPLITLKTGDHFGDLSIQSHTINPYDLVSKNSIYAKADLQNGPCHLFKFNRQEFINALFSEMKESLYQRIMMLKNAEFFEDLSPYALVILASNLQVKEYKLGDVLLQQGSIPSECFIIIEGQCKLVYEATISQSTKVSKFAKKCLQTDIPNPMHYNGINYKQMAQIDWRKEEKELLKDDDKDQQKVKHDQSPTRKASPIKQKDNLTRDKQIKYTFQNEILNQDYKHGLIEYKHLIPFGELKPGNSFGFRSLLDKQLIRRHIIDECEYYSDQLKIYSDTIEQEMKTQHQTITEPRNTFKYDSQSNLHSASHQLLNHQNSTAINLTLVNDITDATKQVAQMIQDLEDSNQEVRSQQMSQQRLLNKQQSLLNQAPQHLNDEIISTQKSDHDQEILTRQQLLIKSKLYDKLMQELLASQLSIVAATSTVKVMVIKREDKNFLNETLKNIIDRKLIERKFRDQDRPMNNKEEVLRRVEEEKEWKEFKAKLEEDILREVAINRKINKLLD